MKKAALLPFLFLCILSCRQKEGNKTAVQPKSIITEKSEDGNFCYLKVISHDSIILNFTRKGDSITGKFDWKPYEKDKKISTFKGVANKNTVNAIGHYFSEGYEYYEELIFIINDNQAIIKYGEMTEGSDGIWRYKNSSQASVQELNKVECK